MKTLLALLALSASAFGQIINNSNASVNTAIAENPTATWAALVASGAAVVVNSSGTDANRGSALLAAYDAAAALTPNSSALSAKNRAAVLIPRGNYKLPSTLTLDTEFVDLIAMNPERGGDLQPSDNTDPGATDGADLTAFRPPGTLVYSDNGSAPFTVVEQTAVDVRMKGFGIAYIGTHANFDFWGYHALNIGITASGANSASQYEDMYFFHSLAYLDLIASGDRHPVGGTKDIAGTWIRCISNGYSWRVGENGTFLATMYDCQAGALSFGGDATGGSFGACRLERCRTIGQTDSLGLAYSGQGGFGGCQSYGIPSISTSVFIDCEAGISSFCSGKNAGGTFIRCRGAERSFGGTKDNEAGKIGSFSGYAEDCIGGKGSFGGTIVSGVGKCTGTLVRCTSTGNTVSTRLEGATIRDSRFTNVTTGVHTFTLLDSNNTISNSDIIVLQGGTGVPIYAASALNVAAYHCRMNNAANDADGLHSNVTNLVTSAGNVVSNAVK